MDGILNIDKPYGITSMEVVRQVKRASGQKRVGHGGTLDPVATGVIPVCLGQATRVMEYLVDGTKEYRAVIELGVTTDTYDALGQVTREQDASGVSLADVEAALQSFVGTIQQVPPMYSALKRQGKRLYQLARAGIEVEREPRTVEVSRIDVVDWSPPLVTAEVGCGRGFYMRSLAYDLGEALGCGGHLKGLVRLRSGPFKVADAVALSDTPQMFEDGTWRGSLQAPDVVLQSLHVAIAGQRLRDAIVHGRPLPPAFRAPTADAEGRCRVYGTDGAFICVLRREASTGQWRSDKVFSMDYSDTEPSRLLDAEAQP